VAAALRTQRHRGESGCCDPRHFGHGRPIAIGPGLGYSQTRSTRAGVHYADRDRLWRGRACGRGAGRGGAAHGACRAAAAAAAREVRQEGPRVWSRVALWRQGCTAACRACVLIYHVNIMNMLPASMLPARRMCRLLSSSWYVPPLPSASLAPAAATSVRACGAGPRNARRRAAASRCPPSCASGGRRSRVSGSSGLAACLRVRGGGGAGAPVMGGAVCCGGAVGTGVDLEERRLPGVEGGGGGGSGGPAVGGGVGWGGGFTLYTACGGVRQGQSATWDLRQGPGAGLGSHGCKSTRSVR